MQHFYHAKMKFWQGHCDNAEINWGGLCTVVNTKWAVRSTVWLRLDQYATTPNTLDRTLDLAMYRGLWFQSPAHHLASVIETSSCCSQNTDRNKRQKNTNKNEAILELLTQKNRHRAARASRSGKYWDLYLLTVEGLEMEMTSRSYHSSHPSTSTYSRLSSLRRQKMWNYV